MMLKAVAWLIILISALLIVVNIPIFYRYVLETSQLALDGHIIAWVRTLIRRFGELLFFALAIGILLRSNEPLAILIAMMSASLGAMYGGSYVEIIGQVGMPLLVTSTIVATMPATFGILLLFTMPDGKFDPAWGRWLVLFIAIFEPIRVFFSVILAVNTIGYGLLAMTALIASIGLWAQIKRYHRATQVYKLQFRWLIFGTLNYLGAILILIMGITIAPPQYHILIQGIDEIGGIVLATCLIVAVSRFRLYDIDLYINQTLVFGTTFLGLGMLVITVFILLQTTLSNLLPIGDIPAIVVVLAVIMPLMRPTVYWLQHWIDTRIYGLRFDLNQFGEVEGYATAPSTMQSGYYRGYRIDDYLIVNTLGRGGLSEVYLAEKDSNLYAIKMLVSDKRYNEIARARLKREAQILQMLNHRNVSPVIGRYAVDNTDYLVLSYIHGQTLEQVLEKEGRLTLSELYPILSDLASGMDYIHSQGIIHRDIKPSNIVRRESDSRVFLVDFGLAIKHTEADSNHDETAIGTLAYMSPEQICDGTDIDHRADLYSLGITVYQLLTGELPYTGNTGQILFGHLNQPLPDPTEHVPDLPVYVVNAIQQVLAKDPDNRFTSASAFLDAIQP